LRQTYFFLERKKYQKRTFCGKTLFCLYGLQKASTPAPGLAQGCFVHTFLGQKRGIARPAGQSAFNDKHQPLPGGGLGQSPH
jgi:hypothetical protein